MRGVFVLMVSVVGLILSAAASDNTERSEQMSTSARIVALDRMQIVMGKMPDAERRVSLDIQVLEEVDCGSYVRRLISYQSEPGSTTPAYLLIPKPALEGTSASLPGVLSLHSTSLDLGHKVVVGLGPRDNRDNAHELAELGHVVIAPAYPIMADYNPDLKGLGYESGTMKAIWDNSRALDLLDSLPYVRSGQYAAIGHSLGGHNALFTAAFDTRIVVAVTSCGFDSFADYNGGDLSGWTQERYMPRLATYSTAAEIPFDFDDVLVAIAPRTVFISAPLGDDNFNWESVNRVVEKARRRIEESSSGGSAFYVRHPDCGHDFPPQIRREAYNIIRKQLSN